MMPVSNILDPVHATLDPTVWDDPGSDTPKLKVQHLHWIRNHIYRILKDAGYEHVEHWLKLVLTGSLTTFQFSDESDCDISLFVDTKVFPEWARGEMIGLMIEKNDGILLPGTTHPMQGYVVARGIKMTDLYQPGLRSGYSLDSDHWIVPPDRMRVHDVAKEMRASYVEAIEDADKMDRLLKYEPDKAVMYWHQLHRRRMSDMIAGKGDYADSNIVYKFLFKRGLIPQIAELTGEHIARKHASPVKTFPVVRKFVYNGDTGQLAMTDFGREEGEVSSHYQLGRSLGIEDPYRQNAVLGTVNQDGWIKFEGGQSKPQTRFQAQQALQQSIPDAKLVGGDLPNLWSFGNAA